MSIELNTGAWAVDSWRYKRSEHQPEYRDKKALEETLQKLSRLPPLVVSWEIEALKHQIAEAQEGKRFVLQGGDCAETFEDCEYLNISKKLKTLLKMSLVLLDGLKKPVIRIGRMAGQYAKPRSSDSETKGGVTLPSYRGAIINKPGFTPEEREPDPELLLRGYERAALTLNYIRALTYGGFADLHHPENWDFESRYAMPQQEAYTDLRETIAKGLAFFESIGGPIREATGVDFYTSHEGLHLEYEQAQTRYVDGRNRWYNLSTHLPWIGMRTTALDGAHVEMFRGIANPVGIKVGPGMTAGLLKDLIRALNPDDEPGKLVLIQRLGIQNIDKHLPVLIEAVQQTGSPVLWICDPMHGNTETTSSGFKTRRFDTILREVEAAFRIHLGMGSRLGGLHFELTGDDVQECTGGSDGPTDSELGENYTTHVDPRLNHAQALELALLIARLYSDMNIPEDHLRPRRAGGSL